MNAMNATAPLALIACCKAKLPAPAKAGQLYISDLFHSAMCWAQAQHFACAILSAKYGLVMPWEVIEPYDETLNTIGAAGRREWVKKVAEQFRSAQVPLAGRTVYMLAGKHYRTGLVDELTEHGADVLVPLEGLGIGEQLSRLKRDMDRLLGITT